MKSLKFLLISLFLVFLTCNVNAYQLYNWTMDLSNIDVDLGAGTAYIDSADSTYTGHTLSTTSGLTGTEIIQYTGGDGTIDVGDDFTETVDLFVNAITVDGTPPTETIDMYSTETGLEYYLVFEVDGVDGKVTTYDNKSTLLDLSDDTWDYAFTSYNTTTEQDQIVSMYLVDENLNTIETLMTAAIISGGGTADGFIGGLGLSNNWGIDLEILSVLNGVFETDDSQKFEDIIASTELTLLGAANGVTQIDTELTVADIPNSYTFTGQTGDPVGFYVVPEPGTMILLGFGLLSLAGIRRKIVKK